MDLRRYVGVLRAHSLLILLCVVVCTAAAAALAWTRTPVYAATSQLFVANGTPGGVNDAYVGGLFTQQRIISCAQVVSSPAVVQNVIDSLDLPYTVGAVQSKIHATVPAGTVLIDVRVEDRSPLRAKAIADAVDEQFSRFVNTLETQTNGSSSVKVSVTSPAEVPTQPASPRKPLYLVLGFLLGLVGGLSGAVLREALNSGIRSNEEAQAITGAPVLTSLSDPAGGTSSPILLTDPGSAQAEEYRRLGAMLAARGGVWFGPKRFVISSAAEGEGKTKVAANLALVFAEDGKRVVLVDANLRRPGLAAVMDVPPTPGLADVVANTVSLQDALRPAAVAQQLDVLPAGTLRGNPSELFGSHAFAALVRRLAGHADVVILDASPVLTSADAMFLARLAVDVLLVSRVGSRADELEAAVQYLSVVGATVVGVVSTPSTTGGRFVLRRRLPRRRSRRRGQRPTPTLVPVDREA